ncbi:putative copper-importing P-type ATPase A [Gimesia chilikensis]|uniref:Putative copper-importing P-type ATPase A n=1 Tax=Gimesia chilikensis TaxID=2605989 RepID=A0A517WDM0_9PLAN|nr:heavy metal translocating P-type ATPase [Gimesia chilikensis]QDU03346.1 putative copper-importing P-type ATPase A [Gimesia chilikensis]
MIPINSPRSQPERTPVIDEIDGGETAPSSGQGTCIHCDLPIPTTRQHSSGPEFCCAGCEVAYAILQDMDPRLLEEIAEAKTAGPSELTYEEMDHPRFLELYAHQLDSGLNRIRLHLEGIHCASCVFVIEKLPEFLPGVINARVNLTTATLDCFWNPDAVALSEIARTLDRLGYRPHPAQPNETERLYRLENRKHLIRLGIAGACAGNVMLIAFALYAGMFTGMSAEHLNLFRWTSAGLALVSIFWPGQIFFKGALLALKTRVPHIDLPVALGITIGGIAGLVNSIRGSGEIYFDSLTVLIFLLLVGRYIQFRQQHHALSQLSLLKNLTPRHARLVTGTEVLTVPIEVLQAEDEVEVRAGDVIPADGVILSGDSSVDESILTGESRPRRVLTGGEVTAGTLNLTSPLRMQVQSVGEQTRIGRLMNLVELGVSSKLPLIELANRIAGVFVVTVILLSLLCLGLWWSSGTKVAVANAISLLIVTCPCALGLATPLALAVAQGKAAKRSILINSGDAVEKLARPGFLWLDKTGTLTTGKMQVQVWQGDQSRFREIATLEQQVVHPIATAILGYIEQQSGGALTDLPTPEDAQARPGKGISGTVNGHQLLIGTEALLTSEGCRISTESQQSIIDCRAQGLTTVLIAVDGKLEAVCGIGDSLRPDSRATLEHLKEGGWSIGILSGDHGEIVNPIARQLDIDPEYVHAGVLPEEKLQIIQQATPRGLTVMVGDGVNDSAALAAASVGIAVHGGAEASLQVADVYLNRPGLSPLRELIDGARMTNQVIIRNLLISLAYNLLAAGLALGGLINPLIAAVLMPISSLTVLVLSFMNRSFRETRA